jgi:serine/threonine protein phosphatase PrpC
MSKTKFLKRSPLSHVSFVSLSHQGKVRLNNEDRLTYQSYATDEQTPRHVLLAVLSDGVGGNRAGEVAAQIGVDSIVGLFGKIKTLDDPASALKEVIIEANQEILNAIEGNQELKGMGATCICALIIEKKLYLGSLGDSRAYLLRQKTMRQLNFDHTWLEDAKMESIPGTKDLTRDHPLAHVLSRYLGSPHPALVDTRLRPEKRPLQADLTPITSLDLMKDDLILLCSDGLTDMLTDKEIKDAVRRKDLQRDIDRLIQLALEKGGHDNVTVILMKVQ